MKDDVLQSRNAASYFTSWSYGRCEEHRRPEEKSLSSSQFINGEVCFQGWVQRFLGTSKGSGTIVNTLGILGFVKVMHFVVMGFGQYLAAAGIDCILISAKNF